ncbi:protein kinase domain-containing protein [Bacillus cereus]|uniref:protein kinase domain-containing protein n=1 Tax=Bacillus cereus TaxID=1396 RepID=UPI0019646031|nr:protein kinase [Bacillus cereus]MBM6770846.1 protein kinase [Bacillus cereus]
MFRKGHIISDTYQVVGYLGQGGNAQVYEVKKVKGDNKGHTYALKMLKMNLKEENGKIQYTPKDVKKYKRFLREFKVVRKHQDKIEGILPIVDSSLPPHPSKKDIPWYVMPLATPMTKAIVSKNIAEVISSISKLSEILINLHKEEICHRDIKPHNIYLYNNTWVFSDFGLVDYPEKEELTITNESVGARSTMAPEMKIDAKRADSKKADIYSLAKTLWIILTNVSTGFEGQYNYKNDNMSLASYIENEYLITLHDLLTRSTSDDPKQRPSAEEFHQQLSSWFTVKDNFKIRNQQEWDFILDEIAPNSPDRSSWSRVDRISNVLEVLSKVNNVNHMFYPSGGGNDLLGCQISNKSGFIELNEGGIVRVVKPRNLYLETFEDSQWNYLLLELEEVSPCGVYSYEDGYEPYIEHVLEIDVNTYIETYHQNYGLYNGTTIPSSAREVCLGLKGNYVIFPKSSHYNFNMDSYSALQSKYETPDEFRNFINEQERFLKWKKKHPQEYEELKAKKEKEKEKERQEYLEKINNEETLVNQIINNINIPSYECVPISESTIIEYYILIQIHPMSKKFFFSKDRALEPENPLTSFWGTFLGEVSSEDEYYKLYHQEDVKKYCKFFEDYFNPQLCEMETICNEVSISIGLKRLRRPIHLFNKSELENLLINGDDSISNRLVINAEGFLELIPLTGNYEYWKYPVLGSIFRARENMVGPLAPIQNYLDYEFLLLLVAWYNHLKAGTRNGIPDTLDGDTEDEIISKITKEREKYLHTSQ